MYMSVFEPFFQVVGTLIAILVLAVQSLIGVGGNVVSLYAPVIVEQVIPATPSITDNTVTASSTQSTTTVVSITPVRTATTITPAKTVSTATKTPSVVATPAAPQLPTLSGEVVNTLVRTSLVNIFCTTASGGFMKPVSGSGIIIDSRGVILTNAHVAQFFLLRDYPRKDNVECVVRQGSPAKPLYKATLLYLPPQWVTDNASEIVAPVATGTGENDYAFLLITGSTNATTPLPASFPTLEMAGDEPVPGEQMLLAGFPAGFLDGIIITTNLYAASSFSPVQNLYTFNDPTHVDVFSLGGSIVSQSGSSGGAAVRVRDGQLLGVITTDTAGTTTADRNLHAITLGHINRSLIEYGQGGITGLLSKNLQKAATEFNTKTAPALTQKLIDAITKR